MDHHTNNSLTAKPPDTVARMQFCLLQMLAFRRRGVSVSCLMLPERFQCGPFVCHDTLLPHTLRNVVATGSDYTERR